MWGAANEVVNLVWQKMARRNKIKVAFSAPTLTKYCTQLLSVVLCVLPTVLLSFVYIYFELLLLLLNKSFFSLGKCFLKLPIFPIACLDFPKFRVSRIWI